MSTQLQAFTIYRQNRAQELTVFWERKNYLKTLSFVKVWVNLLLVVF